MPTPPPEPPVPSPRADRGRSAFSTGLTASGQRPPALVPWSSRHQPRTSLLGPSGAGLRALPPAHRFLGGGIAAGLLAEPLQKACPPAIGHADPLGGAARARARRGGWRDRCSIYGGVSCRSPACSLSRRTPHAASLARSNELVPPAARRVPVVTLHSALPLLPTPAEPPIERHIRQPWPTICGRTRRSTSSCPLYARIQRDASCGRSACGPADVLDQPILRLRRRLRAGDHAVDARDAQLWLWRRWRSSSGAAAGLARGRLAVEARMMRRGARVGSRAVDERIPLKTEHVS